MEAKILLVDATQSEEQVREGEVIITMNRQGELCQIAKYGGVPIDAFAIINWTNIALLKVQELSKFIQKKLEEDAKNRDARGFIAELSAENDR